MDKSCAQRDLVKRSRTMLLLWGLPAATILATGYYVSGGWIVTTAWTLSLAAMGAACLVNARGCGRTHCYFTGPFFLLMAVVSLLHGLQVVSLGPRGWQFIGAGLVLGSVPLWVVPEWILGRYRREPAGPHER